MLKLISPLISPELLKIISEMGHGDVVLLADANFPAYSCGAKYVVRADGVGVSALLDVILELLPIDTFVSKPVKLMEVAEGDNYLPEIWGDFKHILAKHSIQQDKIDYIERFAYYELAKKAYCIISTGERARYANVQLQKGIL